jgi:hypothetical protein
MTWKSWRAGLLAAAVGALAASLAEAQPPAPPGFPPAEARAGQLPPLTKEVPADGPMCCRPTVETKTINNRCYTDRCYNVCYPNCHGLLGGGLFRGGLFHKKCGDGCGECESPCGEEGCHGCSKVYTKKYLVLHIRPEEKRVNVCVPEPVACEAPCPAPCQAPCQAPCGAPAIVPPPGLLHGGPMR